MAKRLQMRLWTRIVGLLVLATGMAYVEASVVVYLRETLVPIRKRYFPDAVRQALPLLDLQQLAEAGPEIASFLDVERARELAALAVLAAMGIGFRRRRGEGMAFFLMGFALWDALYYAFLKLLTGWPASLATWDVLFLIPIPWVAPVWAPLAVSGTLLIAGMLALTRRRRELSAKAAVGATATALAGAGLVLASFMLPVRQAIGGVPARFDWPWFLAGWLLGTAGLLWLVVRPSPGRR